MVFSTTCNDDLVDKTALVEENPKEIREVKVDRVVDLAESSVVASKRSRQRNRARSVERTHKFNIGRNEMEAESSEDGDRDDEEEAREDRNKAVQWTEDDQKSLMDLGISETERNRRLESLIAKRRARKLLSLQIRRTLMNLGNNDPRNQIASILIPKSSSFLPNDSHEAQASPMPGSAPSVLLPMHNPFDLPYDPHEERPNLMGDSFSQEFMAPQQKEIVFCRHESFSLGAFFPGELRQDQETFWCHNFSTSQSAPDLPEYSKFKNQSSSSQDDSMSHVDCASDEARQEDQPSEKLTNLVDTPQEEDRSETQNRSIIVKDVNGESTSSSSSEVNEPFYNANREKVLKSLAFSVPRSIPTDREDNGRTDELIYDSSPSTFDRIRMQERFFHPDDGPHHTPCHSIASDLQVEVSEVSSPPPTTDGNFSLSDGESLILDLGKEPIAGSEDTWVASSLLSGVEENESRSKEVHEVSEKDIIDVGFSRISQKSSDPIASHVLQEKVAQQDSSVTGLSSSLRTELSGGSQVYPIKLNSQTNEAQPPGTFNSSEILPPDNLTLLVLEKAQKSIDKSISHLSNDSDSRKLEGPSYPPKKPATKVNVVCSIKDPVCPANNEIGSSDSIKDTDSKAILMKQEAATELSDPTKKDDSKSSIASKRKFEGPENDYSKSSTEYLDEKFKKQTDEKHIAGHQSKSTDDKNLQHVAGKQGTVEVRNSSSNRCSNDAVALAMQPEVVTIQGPTISSSSPSAPALQEKVLINHASSIQKIHENAQQFDTDMVDKNLLVDKLSENSKPTMPQNAPNLAVGSAAHPSSNKDLEKSKEQYKHPDKSVKESNIIFHVNDSEFSLNKDGAKLSPRGKDNEAHILIKRDDAGNLSKPYQETSSKSRVNSEDQLSKPDKHDTILESDKPVEKNVHVKSIEDSEREFEGLNAHKDIPDNSKSIEKTETREPIQGREREEAIVDIGFSGIGHSFNNSIALAMLPELVVEHLPVTSSSSSSPKSVLQKKFSMDQTLLLNSDQDIQAEVNQSETVMVVNNYLSEEAPESLTLTAPLTVDPTAHPPAAGNSEKLQESSSLSMKPTEESSTIYTENGSAENCDKCKESLNSIDDIKVEVQNLTGDEAKAEPPKKAEEIDSDSKKLTEQDAPPAPSKANSTENIKLELQMLRSHEAKAEPSKPAKETESSSNKYTKLISKEPTGQEAATAQSKANPSESIKGELQSLRSGEAKAENSKSSKEADSISHQPSKQETPTVPPKANSTEDIKGELQTDSISNKLTEQEATTAPSKANSTEDVKSELQTFKSDKAKAELSKPAKEAVSVSNNPTEREAAIALSKANSTEDIKGELETLRSDEAKAEPSKSAKETDFVSNKPTEQEAATAPSKADSTGDTKGELQNLRSDVAQAALLEPVTETDSVSNKPTAQEAAIAPSKVNSTEDTKHELQTLSSLEAKGELLKPAMEIDSRSNEDIESISKKPIEPDAPTAPLTANSIEDSESDLQTSNEAKAEPSKPPKETDSVSSKPIEQEAATDPSKANSTEVIIGEFQSLRSNEAKAEPSKSAKETDSVSNKLAEQEVATAPSKVNSTVDIKGELQTLRSQEAKTDLSKPAMDTDSRSNTDSESIYEKLTEQEVPTAPSKASSSEDIKDGQQTLSSPEAKAELSKPAMETDSRSNKDAESISNNMTEQEFPTTPSKTAEQNDSSNILITKEEEPIHRPRKLIEEPTTISELNKLVVSEMDGKNLKSVAGDSECTFQTSNGSAAVEPSENAKAGNSSSTEDVKGKSKQLNEVEGMKSVGDTECEFQTSNGAAVVKPSENQDLASSSSTEDIKGKSEKLTKAEAIVDPSKLAEDSGSSYNSAASIEIEKPSHRPPAKPIEEANSISNMNRSLVSKIIDKDSKSAVGDTECESKRLSRPATLSGSSENAELVDSRSAEDIKSISKKPNEDDVVRDTLKPVEGPKIPSPNISNANKSVIKEKDGKEDLKSIVGETEGESQILIRPVTTLKPSEVSDVGNTEDIDGKSSRLTGVEDMVGSGKNDNLNNINDTEVSRKSIDPENGVDLAKPYKGSDSIADIEEKKIESKVSIKDVELDKTVNHNTVTELPRQKESGEKASNAGPSDSDRKAA